MRDHRLISAIVILGLTVVAMGLEARLGRWRLKRFLARRGWTLVATNWRPPLMRQVRYRVTINRDGKEVTGVAYIGGPWTGPMWSNRIEFDWPDGDRDAA